MLKDLTDQTQDRALKLEDINVKREKVNKDFEAKLLEMLRKADAESQKMGFEIKKAITDQLNKVIDRTNTIEQQVRGQQDDSKVVQQILALADKSMGQMPNEAQ